MTTKKTLAEFYEVLHFDKDFLQVENHDLLLGYVTDFFETYDIQLLEDCDYRNDTNQHGDYYCDLSSEWADSMVDIYNRELLRKIYKFQYFIDDAIEEFGVPNTPNSIDLARMGQYLFYSRVA